MRILVVIYNHESALAATLDRIPVDFRPRIDEILVFDDASADKTVDVALRWGAANGETPTTVVRHLKPRVRREPEGLLPACDRARAGHHRTDILPARSGCLVPDDLRNSVSNVTSRGTWASADGRDA